MGEYKSCGGDTDTYPYAGQTPEMPFLRRRKKENLKKLIKTEEKN